MPEALYCVAQTLGELNNVGQGQGLYNCYKMVTTDGSLTVGDYNKGALVVLHCAVIQEVFKDDFWTVHLSLRVVFASEGEYVVHWCGPAGCCAGDVHHMMI